MHVTSSKSVRLLGAVLGLGAVVAGATTTPSLLRATQEVVDVQPQWLRVDDSVRGLVRLNDRLTVSLYDSGLQVRRSGRVIFETVRSGSILSAGAGRVLGEGDDRAERIEWTVDSWHVVSLQVRGSRATYSGEMVGGPVTVPASVTIAPAGTGAAVTATVAGVDLVVLHTDRPQAPVGLTPALPDRGLARRAWWIPRAPAGAGAAGGPPVVAVMTSAVRGTRTVTAVRADSDVVVDLRHQGRAEIHGWSPTLRLEVR